MDNETLEQMKAEFLKINKIKVIGKPPKRDTFETNDLITVHTHGWTYKVL